MDCELKNIQPALNSMSFIFAFKFIGSLIRGEHS